MSQQDVDALIKELLKRIDYFRAEFNITYGEVISVLELIKLDVYTELREVADEK